MRSVLGGFFAGVAFTLALTAVVAQSPDGVPGVAAPQRSTSTVACPNCGARVPCDQTQGFWPTDRMIGSFIDRAAEEAARTYDLDPAQLQVMSQQWKDIIPRYLNENRPELKGLLNEFIEIQLSTTAPTPEQMAAFGQRAMPQIEKFLTQVDSIGESMREFMSEDQQVRLDGELAAVKTGMGLLGQRMANWAEGNYDPNTEWMGAGAEARAAERERRRAERQAAEAARQEAMAASGGGMAMNGTAAPTPPQPTATPNRPAQPPATPPKPKDDWEKYVDEFSAKYKLNSEQRQKADNFLRAARSARDEYLDRNIRRIEEAALDAKNATTDEERAKAKGRVDELNAPVERELSRLKERLETLPTRQQRRDAERGAGDQPASPSTQPATR